jgi:hypothetical protein
MDWDDNAAAKEYDADTWDMWDELADTTHQWFETYRWYWGVDGSPKPDGFDEGDWEYAKHRDKLGKRFLRMARTLNASIDRTPGGKALGDADLEEVMPLLRDIAANRQVKDRIAIELATEATAQLRGASARARRLVGMIRARSLSFRASGFVERATQLYIWGFEPETAIMCRAALEAALLNRLVDTIDPDTASPALVEMIRLAGEHGILDRFAPPLGKSGWGARRGSPLWRAMRVRAAGNHAAHEQPGFQSDANASPNAFETIRDLSLVLRALFKE